MCFLLIDKPLNLSSSSLSKLVPVPPDSTVRAILSQSRFRMLAIHMVISTSRKRASSRGSWLPGLTCFPSMSVAPAASTMWIKASALRISSKNWFPRPRPCHAPGTKPAQSISSIGISRIPSKHNELTGLSSTLNSWWTQGVRRYPTPRFGFMVVNG